MTGQLTILIPTDFRVASLNTLRLTLEEIDEPTVNVFLFYCTTLDSSVTELLFYSPKRIVSELMTPEFRDAVSLIINRFENKIGELQIELFHGYAQGAFDTFLNTLKIDTIYLSSSYRLHLPRRAFDPTPYIRKGRVPYYDLTWDEERTSAEEDKLENLFL